MILFAIVFGLSMDYEVFLLSRIKEEYDRTRRQRHRRRRRPGRHRPGDHRRGADHGLRVLRVRARRRPPAQAVRPRARRSPCCSTRRSSAWCSSRRRWSCSATATGGCRGGSTGSCRRSTSRASTTSPRAAHELRGEREPELVTEPSEGWPPSRHDALTRDPRSRSDRAHGQATGRRRIAGEGQDDLEVPRRCASTCAPRSATSPTCRRRAWPSTSTTASSRPTS